MGVWRYWDGDFMAYECSLKVMEKYLLTEVVTTHLVFWEHDIYSWNLILWSWIWVHEEVCPPCTVLVFLGVRSCPWGSVAHGYVVYLQRNASGQ